MNKTILIFEQTHTLRTVFEEELKEKPYDLFFETEVLSFFNVISKIRPDIILINASNLSPSGFAFARMLHELKESVPVPVKMYAGKHYAFDDYYKDIAQVDEIVYITKNNISEAISELVRTDDDEPKADIKQFYFNDTNLFNLSNIVWQKDITKNAIDISLYSMMNKINSLDDVAKDYLEMIANFSRVPAAALCLNDGDKKIIYSLNAANMPEQAINGFLQVCKSDFEEKTLNSNISNPEYKAFEDSIHLERYYVKDIPLAVYRAAVLKDVRGTDLGTVHIIRDGNFSQTQIDFFEYAVEHGDLLFSNALLMKKKLFFEKNIRKAFTRFVPEQIIDDLVKEAGENKKVAVGEKREVAILFSDIRSFTNISEANKPEVIVSFLNRYFTVMVDIIKKHGGTVDKFIGDAIMALFGTPISYEDNARRAVRAAYEMRQALESIPLEDLILPNGMKFNIGIGIHFGDVIAGSLGSKDKTDYTVIGDNVNLASRLEGLTKTYGTQVLVSESVKKDIARNEADENSFKKEFCFRYLDDVKVKGKAKAVPIYAVDRSDKEFATEYKDAYLKGVDLYKQGIFNLAKNYFEKALEFVPEDKAAILMLERCKDFIQNPPENWDGAISFKTK